MHVFERVVVDHPQHSGSALDRLQQAPEDVLEDGPGERAEHVGDREVVGDLVVERVGLHDLDRAGTSWPPVAGEVCSGALHELLGELDADHLADGKRRRDCEHATQPRAEIDEHVVGSGIEPPEDAPQRPVVRRVMPDPVLHRHSEIAKRDRLLGGDPGALLGDAVGLVRQLLHEALPEVANPRDHVRMLGPPSPPAGLRRYRRAASSGTEKPGSYGPSHSG